MRLNPFDFPGAYYANAVANYQLKNFEAAEKSAREASKLKGKQAEPRSYYILGLTLAQKGDFVAASESASSAFLLRDSSSRPAFSARPSTSRISAM